VFVPNQPILTSRGGYATKSLEMISRSMIRLQIKRGLNAHAMGKRSGAALCDQLGLCPFDPRGYARD
jgi:hypothetical protein